MTREDAGKKLKEFRLKAGLTQLAVAKRLKYTSPQYVSNWERGESFPPDAKLGTLAKLYRVSLRSVVDLLIGVETDWLNARRKALLRGKL